MFGNTPPQPDFAGASREQAAAGRQLTAEQTYANRPDISTPWGGVRWTPPTYDPWFSGDNAAYAGGSPTYDEGGRGGGPNIPGVVGGMVGGLGGDHGTFRPYPGAPGNPGGEGGPRGAPTAPHARTPGRWGLEMYLSPEQQAALEAQQRVQAGRSGLAESLLGRARGELGAAPDYGSLPEFGGAVSGGELPQYDVSGAPALPEVGAVRDRAEEALYQRQVSRLNPEWEQRQQQLDSQLRSQGLLPGSPAYSQQMQQFERAREAAYSGARQEAIGGGGAEAQRQFGMGLAAREQAVGEAGRRFGAGMQRESQRFSQAMGASQYATQRRNAQLAEMLQRRGWSLNEVNALLSGQQVGAPQMPGFNQAGVSAPPNLLEAMRQQYGAGLNAYNAQQAQLQGLMSGFGGLAPFMF